MSYENLAAWHVRKAPDFRSWQKASRRSRAEVALIVTPAHAIRYDWKWLMNAACANGQPRNAERHFPIRDRVPVTAIVSVSRHGHCAVPFQTHRSEDALIMSHAARAKRKLNTYTLVKTPLTPEQEQRRLLRGLMLAVPLISIAVMVLITQPPLATTDSPAVRTCNDQVLTLRNDMSEERYSEQAIRAESNRFLRACYAKGNV